MDPSRKLASWKTLILEVGLFLLFLVTFGEFVLKKVWAIIGPLFE